MKHKYNLIMSTSSCEETYKEITAPQLAQLLDEKSDAMEDTEFMYELLQDGCASLSGTDGIMYIVSAA